MHARTTYDIWLWYAVEDLAKVTVVVGLHGWNVLQLFSVATCERSHHSSSCTQGIVQEPLNDFMSVVPMVCVLCR